MDTIASDAARTVAHQIEHATAYAAAKGWAVLQQWGHPIGGVQ